jgi:hypothetical protein
MATKVFAETSKGHFRNSVAQTEKNILIFCCCFYVSFKYIFESGPKKENYHCSYGIYLLALMSSQ